MKDELYYLYVSHGICPKCGKRDAMPNRICCFECLYTMNERSVKAYHEMSDEERQSYLQKCRVRNKKRYQERKAAGICVQCGKRPPESGKVRCTECSIKCRRNATKYNRERGVLPQSLLGDGYHCSRCGAAVEKKKMCDHCLAVNRVSIVKAKAASLDAPDNWVNKPFVFGRKCKYKKT